VRAYDPPCSRCRLDSFGGRGTERSKITSNLLQRRDARRQEKGVHAGNTSRASGPDPWQGSRLDGLHLVPHHSPPLRLDPFQFPRANSTSFLVGFSRNICILGDLDRQFTARRTVGTTTTATNPIFEFLGTKV
jgi:hypothetical protein